MTSLKTSPASVAGSARAESATSSVAKKRAAPRRLSLGATPALAMVATTGLLMVALGDNAARESGAVAEPLFWGGLVLIYAPITFRLLSVWPSRTERMWLAVLLGVSLFLVKVLYSPIGFVFYDELGWWRATNDLLQTGHPFSSNPLVVSTPGFPGLSMLTGALAELTGLGIFHAGVIVIGVTRAMLMLALFLLLEHATRSPRAAGVGVAVYACNPSFLYFNSQFAYESVALLIGVALLVVTVRSSESHDLDRPRLAWGLVAAMALLVGTLTITHHMTAYAVLAFLVTWAALVAYGDRSARAGIGGEAERSTASSTINAPRSFNPAALPAVLLAFTAGVWFALVAGGVTVTELGGIFSSAIDSALDVVFGNAEPKELFVAGGQNNTWAARVLAVASVGLLLAAIPLGLRMAWRGSVSNPLQRTLALISILYVATLGLRLTQDGTEISERASAFVFLGLAFLVAVLVRDPRWPRKASGRHANSLLLTGLALVIFLGSFIVGEPPQGRQPGPFLVGAERRSISAQGLAAAEFAVNELPPGSRILVDHANSLLLGSYGGLEPVVRRVEGIPIATVFFPKSFDQAARRVIRDGRIDYIVVDSRLARTPPVGGYYFSRGEPRAYRYVEPIRRASLRKFSRVPGLTKVYGNGPIGIYETSGLRSG